jgi:type IV secretion system protein TrbE
MLNVKEIVHGYNRTARGFQELLPYMCLWDDKTVATLDQGMLAIYKYEGLDAEGRSDAESSAAVTAFERAFADFGSGSTMWTYVDRRQTVSYPKGKFSDPVATFIDDVWEKQIISNQYENSYSMAIHQRANRGSMALFDTIDLLVKEEGIGFMSALFKALKTRLSPKARRSLDARVMAAAKNSLEEKLAILEAGMRSLKVSRLKGSKLLAYLHNRVSPATPARTEFPVPEIPSFLSNMLCNDHLQRKPDSLVFSNHDKKHVGVVSLKGFTGYGATFVGQLDWLTTISGDVTVCHCFRFIDRDIAQSTIEGIEKYNMSKSVPFLHRVMTSLNKSEPTKFNEGRLALAQDAKLAQVDLIRDNRAFGHHNLTVLCFGDTHEEMLRVREQVIQNLRESQFVGHAERMHQLSAFSQTIPGQWSSAVRWNFVSFGNAADLAPIRTLTKGPNSCEHFEKELRRPFPVLTSVPTTAGTPAFIDLWQTGIGHMKVIGPSGAGKSTVTNFLLSQFRKYEPCRTIIIDKDFSCMVPTLLQGGIHIDLSPEAKNVTRMSPLSLVGDPLHHPFIVNWIIEMIESGRNSVMCSPAEIDKITNAVRGLADLEDRNHWTLSNLAPGLGPELAAYLGRWVQGGADGQWFDNPPVELELSNHICFECKELFGNPTVASLAMSYLFYIIECLLDDSPTIVNIEETWFFLEDEKFAKKIDDFLRTLRKRNGALWIVTQTLQEIDECSIRTSILTNIQNTLYLPNRNILQSAQLYESVAGLLPEEIHRIANAIEKQQYYLKTPLMSRMLDMQFPDEIIAAISAGSRVRKVFAKHYDTREDTPDWRENYFSEALS